MTAEPMQDIPEKYLDEAVRWVVRLESGGVASSDREDFEAWLAGDPRRRTAYRVARRGWTDLAAMGRERSFARLLGEPTRRERMIAAARAGARQVGRLIRPPSLRPVRGAAAAVAVAVIAVLSLLQWPDGAFGPRHETGIAEICDVVLADGSVVTLGARSRIAVEFTPRVRRVSLDRGEAFFSVVRDPARPFIVAVGDTLARVVGTQFDVHRGPESVRIAVLEGVVEVVPSAADLPAPLVPPSATHVLSAGEGILAAHGAPLEKAHLALGVKPGEWRTGRFVYNGSSLLEVVADINRYYRGEVVIGDVGLKDLRVTTSFRLDQIEQMLESLEAALPLHVERRTGGEIRLLAAAERQ